MSKLQEYTLPAIIVRYSWPQWYAYFDGDEELVAQSEGYGFGEDAQEAIANFVDGPMLKRVEEIIGSRNKVHAMKVAS